MRLPPAPPRLPAVCLVLGAFVASSLGIGPAHAQSPETTAPPVSATPPTSRPVDTTTDPAVIGDERVAPEILGVAVSSPDYDLAMGAYRTIAAQLDQTRVTYATALTALVELDAQDVRLRRQSLSAGARRAAAEQEISDLRAAIQEIAVTTYIAGGASGAVVGTVEVDGEEATRRSHRRALTETVLDQQITDLAEATDAQARAAREEDRANLLLRSLIDRRDETRFVRDSSLAAGFVLASELAAQATEVADARLTAIVDGTDFQFVALDAYVRGAAALAARAPSCAIRWEVLAGISRTEGRHGTYGASDLGPDGNVQPPIIGIPLDGNNNTARVGDTDGGQWDGDGAFDRAVGPMQFIPSSWRTYGADGNGDLEIDPQNLYDAALAAGNLLCTRAVGLNTPGGLTQALLSYNNSTEYGRVVSDYIAGYDALELF